MRKSSFWILLLFLLLRTCQSDESTTTQSSLQKHSFQNESNSDQIINRKTNTSDSIVLDQDLQSLLHNFTNNQLWIALINNCRQNPTFSCLKLTFYNYLKSTLDHPGDIQFTSFIRFRRNSAIYDAKLTSDNESTTFNYHNHEAPLQEISRSLHDNTIKFLMTHDVELNLPETWFEGSVLKVSPRAMEDNGALVKLDIMPRDDKDGVDVDADVKESTDVGHGRIFFKKIKNWINERLVWALLAILLVIKLIAVKVLFVLPAIIGAAAAKKLIFKILLFLFPFLHKLFSFCAYVPYGTKYHHHHHKISHIHHVAPAPHHHHHGPYKHYHGSPHHHHKHGDGIEIIAPHANGPPDLHNWGEEHKEFYKPDEAEVEYYGGGVHDDLISHRHDEEEQKEEEDDNSISSWFGFGSSNKKKSQPPKKVFGKRPTPTQIENMILKAEREALLKSKLQQERLRIQAENLRLQEELKKAIKIQEKLKLHSAVIANKLPQNLPASNLFTGQQIAPPAVNAVSQYAAPSQYLQTPIQNKISTAIEATKVQDLISKHHQPVYSAVYQQTSTSTTTVKPVQVFEKDFQKAAAITYDPFYSPILAKIDKLLNGMGFQDEPCRERLICSMYKNPTKFSPHSNLLSAELSRDPNELQKPTATNSAVIRFYRYVQAARDGQDKRDCLRLYASCAIITE